MARVCVWSKHLFFFVSLFLFTFFCHYVVGGILFSLSTLPLLGKNHISPLLFLLLGSCFLGIVLILGMASNESRDPSPVWQDSQHPVHGRLGFPVPLAFLCWQVLAQHLCFLHW